MTGHEEEIARIKRAKNKYEVLGVSKDASDDDLKRAYKKLVVKTHPDKNPLKGAEEAFKAVNDAFSTLSDPNKRKVYDKYGEEGLRTRESGGGAGHNHGFAHYGGGMHHADVDLEEFLRQMFGMGMGGMPQGGGFQYQYRRYPNRQQQHGHAQGQQQQSPQAMKLLQLLQLIPLLLLLFYIMYMSGASDGPSPFSLSYSLEGGYKHARRTKLHNVKYFVTDSFAEEYGRNPYKLRQLEDEVYTSYKSYLHRRCRHEQHEKYVNKQNAMRFSGKKRDDMLARAEQSSLQSCLDLQEFLNKFG